jgi:hypothetical protein
MRKLPLAAIAAASLALSAATARADLTFANPAAEVGEVRSGAPLRQGFAFTNAGTTAVEVTDLRTGCGCLKPKLEKRAYAPGEGGEIVLEVHTLSQPAGEHTWRLQVAYRAGGEPREAELSVHGRVVIEVAVRPAALTIMTGSSAAHEIVLTDLRDKPLAVTGVQTSSPHLTGQVSQTTTDGDGHRVLRIALALSPTCPDGRHEETVALVTDDAGYRELTVPVTVVKRPRQAVTASPAAVALSAARGQAVPSRIVLLRPAGEGAVEVRGVEADDPAVVCTWAAGPDRCATLKVSIDRTKLAGDSLHSAIHVHINKPVSETVTVPVTCRVE